MKKAMFWTALIVAALLAAPVLAQTPPPADPGAQPAAKAKSTAKVETDTDKVSYGLGVQLGQFIKKLGLEPNKDLFMQGLDDMIANREPAVSEKEIGDAVRAFAQKAQKEHGEKNQKEGDAFLEANKTKEGVKVTASGLQYKVITEGDGASPVATDKVKVNYAGRLIDGTEFDSSYKRGEPATFGVGQVIKGWTEALQLMKKGAKWQLFIPAALAYGSADQRTIPANSVLIFDVELLDINPPEAAQQVELDKSGGAAGKPAAGGIKLNAKPAGGQVQLNAKPAAQ